MPKYVLSYDIIDKSQLELTERRAFHCTAISPEEFQLKLVSFLCAVPEVESIQWINRMTLTFTSRKLIMDHIGEVIDSWNLCVDYHLAKLYERNESGNVMYVTHKRIRQKNAVKAFNKLVDKLRYQNIPTSSGKYSMYQ